MERLLGFDAQLLFDSAVTAVNIFILFFALSYFLFNPIKNFLEQRKEKIAEELKNASLVQKQAEERKAEYEGKLRKVNWEAERILEKADKMAKQHQAELVREAKAECVRLKDQAGREIELSRQQVMDEMKQEVTSMAASMAMQIMAGLVDTRVQEMLVERTLKEMSDVKWRS